MIVAPFGFLKSPAEEAASFNQLGSLVPSNLLDLESTIQSSYSGTGQTWQNLNPSPADGALQADYEPWLGVDGTVETKDPVFTGTPDTPGAHWVLGTTDDRGFQMKLLTDMLKKLHRTSGGQPFTIIAAGKFDSSSVQVLFGNNASGTAELGLRLELAGGGLRIRQTNGSTINDSSFGSGISATAANYMIAIKACYDAALSTDNGFAINAASFTGFSLTSGASAADAVNVWDIGANGPGLLTSHLNNNAELRSFSLFNDTISDADLALIKSEYEARHQITYS